MTKLSIHQCIADYLNGLSCSEIADKQGVWPQAVHYHLRKLQKCGLNAPYLAAVRREAEAAEAKIEAARRLSPLHGNSKLTMSELGVILRRYATGDVLEDIARDYGRRPSDLSRLIGLFFGSDRSSYKLDRRCPLCESAVHAACSRESADD